MESPIMDVPYWADRHITITENDAANSDKEEFLAILSWQRSRAKFPISRYNDEGFLGEAVKRVKILNDRYTPRQTSRSGSDSRISIEGAPIIVINEPPYDRVETPVTIGVDQAPTKSTTSVQGGQVPTASVKDHDIAQAAPVPTPSIASAQSAQSAQSARSVLGPTATVKSQHTTQVAPVPTPSPASARSARSVSGSTATVKGQHTAQAVPDSIVPIKSHHSTQSSAIQGTSSALPSTRTAISSSRTARTPSLWIEAIASPESSSVPREDLSVVIPDTTPNPLTASPHEPLKLPHGSPSSRTQTALQNKAEYLRLIAQEKMESATSPADGGADFRQLIKDCKTSTDSFVSMRHSSSSGPSTVPSTSSYDQSARESLYSSTRPATPHPLVSHTEVYRTVIKSHSPPVTKRRVHLKKLSSSSSSSSGSVPLRTTCQQWTSIKRPARHSSDSEESIVGPGRPRKRAKIASDRSSSSDDSPRWIRQPTPTRLPPFSNPEERLLAALDDSLIEALDEDFDQVGNEAMDDTFGRAMIKSVGLAIYENYDAEPVSSDVLRQRASIDNTRYNGTIEEEEEDEKEEEEQADMDVDADKLTSHANDGVVQDEQGNAADDNQDDQGPGSSSSYSSSDKTEIDWYKADSYINKLRESGWLDPISSPQLEEEFPEEQRYYAHASLLPIPSDSSSGRKDDSANKAEIDAYIADLRLMDKRSRREQLKDEYELELWHLRKALMSGLAWFADGEDGGTTISELIASGKPGWAADVLLKEYDNDDYGDNGSEGTISSDEVDIVRSPEDGLDAKEE